MNNQAEIYQALLDGKILSNGDKFAKLIEGDLCLSTNITDSLWYVTSEYFNKPSFWYIYKPPELYNFECKWIRFDKETPIYPATDDFDFHKLAGKRTKVTIEVIP